MPIIVEHLTHTYVSGVTEYTAVNDVSLTIEDGEFLGIIGQTGSGKSTLVQHLNGLLQPTGGRVIVNGIDLADKKTRKMVRSQVGMVFQYPEHQLFEETVYKDIAFGPNNVGIPEEQIDGCIRTAMDKVGLRFEKYAQKSPFELSGGQKRRVALAGILAMQPKMLVLDEPMAGLDPQGREEILGFIRNFHEEGMSIVMVSHSMDDIATLADRVAVMNDAKLYAIGTPSEIFSRAEELLNIGLGVPKAAHMAALLRARGIDVPLDVYKLEQLSEYICRRCKNAE